MYRNRNPCRILILILIFFFIFSGMSWRLWQQHFVEDLVDQIEHQNKMLMFPITSGESKPRPRVEAFDSQQGLHERQEEEVVKLSLYSLTSKASPLYNHSNWDQIQTQ